jgi:hypothetical protein
VLTLAASPLADNIATGLTDLVPTYRLWHTPGRECGYRPADC